MNSMKVVIILEYWARKAFQTLFKWKQTHSWQQVLTFAFPRRHAQTESPSSWIKSLTGYKEQQKEKQLMFPNYTVFFSGNIEWKLVGEKKKYLSQAPQPNLGHLEACCWLSPVPWDVDEQFYSSQHCLNLAADIVRSCQRGHVWSAKVFGQMVCVNLCLSANMQPVPVEYCRGRKREEQF